MPRPTAARHTWSVAPVILHARAGAVAVDDEGDLQRVGALAHDVAQGRADVGPGVARAGGRQIRRGGPTLARLQEQLDAWQRHGLGEVEAAVVRPFLDADDVDAATAMRHAVLLCVEHLGIEVVDSKVLQGLQDGPEVLPLFYLDEARHVLQHENARFPLLQVVQDVEEDLSPAPPVLEALLQPGRGERLAGKTCHVQVRLRGARVVPLREVVIEDLGGEVCHDGPLGILVDVAGEDVVYGDAQIVQRHEGRLHA
mmetsp:Transcript_98059/g.305376  ORF Transcript_98059/g.305376 Transcript_98059/m.305376 type:complete len:255 (-) Transcript_98059:98-862(-)